MYRGRVGEGEDTERGSQRERDSRAVNDAMDRYATGDDAAFVILYDVLAPRLLAFLRRGLHDDALARDSLRLTREKFDLGVATIAEVTQAEGDVASSDLDYITSLFAHNLAKLSLAREMGNADKRLDDYLHPVVTR